MLWLAAVQGSETARAAQQQATLHPCMYLQVISTPATTWSWMRPLRGLPSVGTMNCRSACTML